MFALLSKAAARLVDVQFDSSSQSESAEGDDLVSINLDAIRDLVMPRPHIPWRQVRGACESAVLPMYKRLHDTLAGDVEHLARLLSELDLPTEGSQAAQISSESQASACARHNVSPCGAPNSEPEIPLTRRKRRRSSQNEFDGALVIPSSHPSIPTIVITPCNPTPSELLSGIPYQDASFGNKLTVPRHPAFNASHPPLNSTPSILALRLVETWQYIDGHWRAVLPPPEEQARKGMFSRPVSIRRKANIGCRRRPVSHR